MSLRPLGVGRLFVSHEAFASPETGPTSTDTFAVGELGAIMAESNLGSEESEGADTGRPMRSGSSDERQFRIGAWPKP